MYMCTVYPLYNGHFSTKVALLYRGALYVEIILYSKECNWYTRCCPLNGGVRYRECPLREAILYMYIVCMTNLSISVGVGSTGELGISSVNVSSVDKGV